MGIFGNTKNLKSTIYGRDDFKEQDLKMVGR